MFDTAQIKVLHLEPTTVCNASCPQCHREDDRFFNSNRDSSDLVLEQVIENFSPEFIRNLDKMFMCGNFGDPAAGKDTVAIYQHFLAHNPGIVLGMNTNGSLRGVKWWQELAEIFSNPLSYVVFSIDGLEDTNPIYRRSTVWSKIMENAQAFIQAGGSAHWDMLIYQHNEHQIDQAKALAKEMGFTWFRAKVSKRFATNPVAFLQPPRQYQLPNVDNGPAPIRCHALVEQSIYMAANGHVLPCCWFGAEVFTLDDRAQHLLEDWNNRLIPSWQTNPHRICSATCAVDDKGTSFSKQWKIEEALR